MPLQMTEGDTPSASMSPRRAVLLTLAAIAALCILAGGIGGGVYLFKVRADEIAELKSDLATAKKQLGAAQEREHTAVQNASQQWSKGYAEGSKDARDFSQEFGPLSALDPGWHIIEVVEKDGKKSIDASYHFDNCKLTYRDGKSLYTRPYGDPC